MPADAHGSAGTSTACKRGTTTRPRRSTAPSTRKRWKLASTEKPCRDKSTRAVTWITAEGQRVREESYALLNSGEWALTGSAVYEFDTQNRWVKRTAGNGRLTERELMCDGGPLWEIDENGIRTDYAYDTARQLVEVTRSAVMDGETVITPETITTYVRDAAGRVLSTRQDTGAMTTRESATYDLLGRTTSTTDVLGRVTTYAYSQDGLTVTQTVPSGATFITRSAPDGTVMEESGTGQRHVIYAIDLVSDGVRTFTKAVSGETQTELQRSIVNGAGETLRTGGPNTTGGVIYTRNTYNAGGSSPKRRRTRAMRPRRWPRPCGNTTPSATKRKKPGNSPIRPRHPTRASPRGATAWNRPRMKYTALLRRPGTTAGERPITKRRKRCLPPSHLYWKAKSFPSTPEETLPNNGANTARAPSGRRKAAFPLPMS